MEFRFVDEHDPVALRRRRLQAQRTQRFRQRRKEEQYIEPSIYQAESSQTVDQTAADNVQTALGNDLLADTEESGHDTISPGELLITSSQEDGNLVTIDTGPDYYDEEIVGADSTDEQEDQMEPRSPDVFAGIQTGRPHDNTWNDLQYATQKFIQQYLVGVHSCGAQEHRESLAAHIEAEGASNHHGIANLFPRSVPHTLDKQYFLETQTCSETPGLSPTQWQELFSGHTPGQFEGKPKQACLHAENSRPTPPGVSFDIDSILGFMTSPATAIHGIRFYSAPQYGQNISTDVHLTLDRLDPDPERPRLIPSRLKDVPHFIFARAEGADFITFHLFFPHLPCSRDFNRLTDEQLSRWFDDIFYPAVRQVYDVDRLQHLPASYRHALATCRAPQVENHLFEAPSRQAQLRMSYFLPPQGMQQLWDHVLTAVCQPGYQDFRDPELYMEAKCTKLFFKYPDAPSDLLEVMNSFDCKLHRILDFSHMRSDRFYIDVGKETCPMPNGVSSPEPQTYLWRRCCIRHHLGQLYDGNIPKSGQNFYHESMLRDAGGMTTLTPVRSRLRRGGILYDQMYSLTKEIVDAARTYPFQNPDLRHLALDPQFAMLKKRLRIGRMSPQRLVEGLTRLRDHFSTRDRSRKKRNPAEQSFPSDHADAQVQPQPQSQQLSSTAVHSTAITATPSQNVPVQTEANEADTQSEGKPSSKSDLWDKALAHLSESEYDRDIVVIVKAFAENSIGDNATADGRSSSTEDLAKDISERMAQAIQDRQHSSEQREWKVTIGDKEYSVRGLVDKTVNILNKFVGVGDVAVSFDPVHAALPWAAVRFVLVCDTYRRIYMARDPALRPPADILDLLETSIVQTYATSLLFLGFAIHLQGSRSRTVSAPFKMNEVESYIESLQESGDQLSQAADNCEKNCSLQNRAGVKELLSYAKESHQIMQAHSVLLMDIHQRMVFDKLRTAEGAAYDSHANEHEARCHPQTRVDLLAQIYQWAGDPDSEGDRGKAARFFPTIATQLVRRLPFLMPHIQDAIETDPCIGEMAVSKQFEKLIRLPLTKIPSSPQNPSTVVIVIDALDECNQEKDIQAIVSLLPQVKQITSVHLKFFVTSRPEIPVYVEFRRIREPYKDFILHLVDEPTVEHDITAFLNSKLTEIRNGYNIHPLGGQPLPESWPSSTEIHDLVKMAVPLFIFAATACQQIQKGKHGDPEENLKKILERTGGTQISKLNELYLFVLEQLLDDPIDSGEELLKRFQEIVGAIVILADPLSTISLAKLLDIAEKRIRHVVGLLPSVLYIPSERSAPIKPLHLSFRDFLINRDKHKTDQFWVDEKETHKRLVVRCFQLLMHDDCLKKDMCDLRTPGVARSDIDKGKIDERLPLEAQYACLYWVYHLKESHERIRDRDQVHEFLELHFLHWLEALSLIGRISESIGFVDGLQSIVDPEKGAQVLGFLRDAKRFVLNYRWIIDTAPLQLYSSAVVFAPKQSIVWNMATGAEEQTFEGHSGSVNSVAFSNDGKRIASGSYDNTVKVWNMATGAEEQTFEGHSGSVNSVAFSNDGKRIASGSYDNTVKVWNMATGAEEQTFEGHSGSVNSVAFSNDGKRIASGSYDNTVKVWNMATGEEELTLEGHTQSVSSVAFSNDGKLIASGSVDETIKIWNVAIGEEEQTLEGHRDWVASVAFSNDGKRIASGSYDNTVKVWNMKTGAEELTLEGHTQSVRSVAYSNDGKLIASGSYDNTIKIWHVATGINIEAFDAGLYTDVLSFTDDDSVLVTTAGRLRLGFRDIMGGPDGRKVLWLPPDFRPAISRCVDDGAGLLYQLPLVMGPIPTFAARAPSPFGSLGVWVNTRIFGLCALSNFPGPQR
uniref:Nephrocystin 3-like N-terminal domain-containing protein n=1 Tax=Fusarium oxysporum (strain Fo5176) TaxID=660025 RepID=A0A0D2XTA0_FUSOF